MKVYAFILLYAFCNVQCRKILQPLDKSANTAFINMEGGGARPPPSQAQPVKPPGPPRPAGPAPAQPAVTPKPVTPKPAPPQLQPTQTFKPVTTSKPQPAPPKAAGPTITPKPVNPPRAPSPITTPGPGTVKQLVTFYDSQGKASPIRPYTYSQAVKQG